MKTQIFTHSGVEYYAEIKRDKKATSNYNHFIWIYKIGEDKPITGSTCKNTSPLESTLKNMIDKYNNESSLTLAEFLS